MHGWHEGKRGGRKRVEEGLSEEGREHGSKGGRETSRRRRIEEEEYFYLTLNKHYTIYRSPW